MKELMLSFQVRASRRAFLRRSSCFPLFHQPSVARMCE